MARRIQQYTRELPYEQRCVIISKRDYRLMRAVVRAAEKEHGSADSRMEANCRICLAIDAFNAPEKRKS